MAAAPVFLLLVAASLPVPAAGLTSGQPRAGLEGRLESGLISPDPVDISAAFDEWRAQYSIEYEEDEAADRRKLWSDRVEVVNTHNTLFEAGKIPYRIAMNQFAAHGSEEFAATHFGLRGVFAEPSDCPVPVASHDSSETVDWRGALVAVKDQGQCGSCWAFSSVATLEGAYNINNKEVPPISFSEQQLVDCVMNGIFTCTTGGLMGYALDYVATDMKGELNIEDDYPYTATSLGTCEFSGSSAIASGINGYVSVTAGDEQALKAAVQVTVVSVGIDASDMTFMLYSSGVFYSTTCSSSMLDHGVAVVGYGSSTARDRPAGIPEGSSVTDFWIVRNSWSTSWGVGGHIYMARNMDNNCGIATYANYAVIN